MEPNANVLEKGWVSLKRLEISLSPLSLVKRLKFPFLQNNHVVFCLMRVFFAFEVGKSKAWLRYRYLRMWASSVFFVNFFNLSKISSSLAISYSPSILKFQIYRKKKSEMTTCKIISDNLYQSFFISKTFLISKAQNL